MPTPIAQKYLGEAELFRENGLCKEAIEAYKKAIETDPSFISAYYNLAVIYHQTQQFYNAITSLKKVIELDPGDASIFNNLGVLYFTINVFDEAKKYFEKSLSIEPDYKKAKNNLEKVQLKLQMIQAQSFKQSAEAGSNNKRLKIGFVSIWFERGQSYVTKTLRDVIAKNHETFVFARTGGVFGQPKLEVRGYWDIPNLTTYPDYQIPPDVLTQWIRGNNLDMVIFNEEYDWNLVMAAKASGTKILTYLDYYKEDWKPYMSLYDAVLCSTKRTFHLVKDFCKAFYIGWGIDTELFKPKDNGNGKYTFFHNAGWLGINYRKMTPAVITAFEAISRYNTDVTLFIHAQTELERLPPEIITLVHNNSRITYHVETVPAPGLYHKGSILVFPSRLEGLGLPLLEGMACGLPAIATDAPPMSEFVKDGYNGLLVKVANRLTRHDNIAFPEEIVDINDLTIKMLQLANNNNLRSQMSDNSRRYAGQCLNINILKNKINRSLFTVTQPNYT
ncbi:MAG: tetratricopeptide repeat protein [Candidatus Brocadiaceae bacterium]|nr:tetratricopeptide repeat protein [Candidatus Brocadiaceae bacterium]